MADGGAELAYTDSGGAGDTVLLIHGSGLADWFTPLAATDALAGYRVIRLVRAGYTGATAPTGLTVTDHAAHTFVALVCGAGYRDVMTDTLGAAVVSEAENRCGYLFTDEMPAVEGWTLSPAATANLRTPVLLVQGGASPPPVHRLVTHLAGRLPDATTATVPDANHLLPLTRPVELARVIDEFCRSSTVR